MSYESRGMVGDFLFLLIAGLLASCIGLFVFCGVFFLAVVFSGGFGIMGWVIGLFLGCSTTLVLAEEYSGVGWVP